MNILSEQQERARQLSLPRDGLLTDVSREFVAELQLNDTFVEYNQQMIVNAGRPADYVFCVIDGRVNISRRNDNFGKGPLAALDPGHGTANAKSSSAPRRKRKLLPKGK
jgi:hypothetical protein